jgi:uncharacterized protein (TIGR04255 family)
MPTATLPMKLSPDAILEALCEFRFEVADTTMLPEVVTGRLVDRDIWRQFDVTRLMPAEIAAQLHNSPAEFRYQPVLELRDQQKHRIVRVGSNVLSYHLLRPYPGWNEKFRSELFGVVDFLFERIESADMKRIGLRYLNAVTPREHGIDDISGLNFKFSVAGKALKLPQMVMYQRDTGTTHLSTVRISSPNFVSGSLPNEMSAFIDVDVSNHSKAQLSNPTLVKEWLETARELERGEFFGLWKSEDLRRLGEVAK